MEHSFNIELASKYGIEEAILIQNFTIKYKHHGSN